MGRCNADPRLVELKSAILGLPDAASAARRVPVEGREPRAPSSSTCRRADSLPTTKTNLLTCVVCGHHLGVGWYYTKAYKRSAYPFKDEEVFGHAEPCPTRPGQPPPRRF